MAIDSDNIRWFRNASPYIDAHRGKTFVLCLQDDALASDNLDNIISDLALLNALGIRLALAYSSDARVREALDAPASSSAERLIIGPRQVETMNRVIGAVSADLTARFGAGLPDFPSGRRELTVVSGNFVMARPLGVIDGVDHQQTGAVRRVNREALRRQLDGGAIVLLPPCGHSPSGETFSLEASSVAREAACALGADKLICFSAEPGVRDENGAVINEIELSARERLTPPADPEVRALLAHCDHACRQGVSRCHIISFSQDGALLEELFTRDGCGTQVTGHSYERIRKADTEDVPGILRLIAPLEAAGVLVKRSRELLESEIDRFTVTERDGLLISCAALYPFAGSGELACLVTHPDYRNGARGDRMLNVVERQAAEQGMDELFVLTTQSAHWFTERGFVASDPDSLPDDRKGLYNYQRNAFVLRKRV